MRLVVTFQSEQMFYLYLLPTTKATILHKNFNFSDCANIRLNVSLQIALIQRVTEISYRDIFCWSVDQLTFCHKFCCCGARLDTVLTQNISLDKCQNCLVWQNSAQNDWMQFQQPNCFIQCWFRSYKTYTHAKRHWTHLKRRRCIIEVIFKLVASHSPVC